MIPNKNKRLVIRVRLCYLLSMKHEHLTELNKYIEELEDEIRVSSKRLRLFQQMKNLVCKNMDVNVSFSELNRTETKKKAWVDRIEPSIDGNVNELKTEDELILPSLFDVEKIEQAVVQKHLFNTKLNMKFVSVASQAEKDIKTVKNAQVKNTELLLILKKEAKGSTIKEDVINLLEFYGRGVTALNILEDLKKRYNRRNLMRSSLSPQLSRLKQEGKLEYFDKKWILSIYLDAKAGIIGDANDVD